MVGLADKKSRDTGTSNRAERGDKRVKDSGSEPPRYIDAFYLPTLD